MLSNNINNSFNIFDGDITKPNLVNDEEIRVAVYVKNTKRIYNYGYSIGFENKFIVENCINILGVKDKAKIDNETKQILLYSYINDELRNNGFFNMEVNIDTYFQDRNIEIIIKKEQLEQDYIL